MSNELKEFYRAYKSWLDAGATNHQPFKRDSGLCANINVFCKSSILYLDVELSIFKEMTRQFRQAGLSSDFPFGMLQYCGESRSETQHLNPRRVKWVEEHAK